MDNQELLAFFLFIFMWITGCICLILAVKHLLQSQRSIVYLYTTLGLIADTVGVFIAWPYLK